MLNDLVKSCRSYRSFSPDVRISREMLLSFVDTARISASTRNSQPLKYRLVYTQEECDKVLPLTRWAGALTHIKLPPVGHAPVAYVVVCHDTNVAPAQPIFLKDVGICSELIMLAATEQGFGGCMIGSFSPDRAAEDLSLAPSLRPQLVLALGKPDEQVELTDAPDDGSVTYYRENGVHYVQKRALKDIVLE